MFHVFNISALVARIEKNKESKNLYEKVNQLLKGAKLAGTKPIVEEIESIIDAEYAATKKHLYELKEGLT